MRKYILMMENCVLLGILTVLAWLDIKDREFPLLLMGVSCSGVICVIVATGGFSIKEAVGGACVGGVLLICALVSDGSVGMGDGLLFCITGICLGLWRNLFLLLGAAAICAVCGIILIASKRCTRKDSLPFAPFVLASDVLLLAMTS